MIIYDWSILLNINSHEDVYIELKYKHTENTFRRDFTNETQGWVFAHTFFSNFLKNKTGHTELVSQLPSQ